MSNVFLDLLAKVKKEKMELCTHSGKVQVNDVFIATEPLGDLNYAGASPVAGESFVADVLPLKPFAIVCRPSVALAFAKEAAAAGVRLVPHESPRSALGELAQARYDTDNLPISVVGITGTNGKTTTTYLLEQIFAANQRKVGVLGTINYRWANFSQDAALTTPSCLETHKMLAEMVKSGVSDAFVEVSSHAIDQQRLAGVNFSCVLFTNLTQDHLDYHKDMEAYFNTKASLFLPPSEKRFSVINADDPYGARLLKADPNAIAYGFSNVQISNFYLHGKIVKNYTQGLELEMNFNGQQWILHSPLIGEFNASNLLAAQAVALILGFSPEDFAVLETYSGVSGRFERVINNKNLDIFVDYAHTPDALENVLKTLHSVGFKKIITLFGCGGDRDKTKRALMGEVVSRYTDIAILTSDNPRNENPETIMAEVELGMGACAELYKEVDRYEALKIALLLMRQGDALLVAGKGHEAYQIIGDVKHEFSDQQKLQELLA